MYHAGSARRLDRSSTDRSSTPGPFHGFTVSRSGKDSQCADDGMRPRLLSRAEMGTIVHS